MKCEYDVNCLPTCPCPQDRPPAPTDPALFLMRSPNATLYVRPYRRRPRESRVLQQAGKLRDALDRAGEDWEVRWAPPELAVLEDSAIGGWAIRIQPGGCDPAAQPP